MSKQKQAKSDFGSARPLDAAKFEFVNGRWLVNDQPVTSMLTEIALAPELWIVRKDKKNGVFATRSFDSNFRSAIRVENHWCESFVRSHLRSLVEAASSAIYCSTYRLAPGGEKEKYKACDAASLAFENRFK
jgi:hypothetical protein